MSYRRLNEREIEQVIRERNAFQLWRSYASFAANLYGSAAERIAVSLNSDYNDETFYDFVEEVKVYDQAGQELTLDLSTDWWQTRLAQAPAKKASDDEDERNDWLEDVVSEQRCNLPADWSCTTFFVSKPPQRFHRNLYVPA